ncbi:MAG: coniferyl aldehyde dehydrogenase [Deltaproteobacteria bacterium]|nr:coniferyl aldehyde dehydrogenase [Deltaproteobacteria bacterium]
MSTAVAADPKPAKGGDPSLALKDLLEKQQQAFDRDRYPTLAERKARLDALDRLLREKQDAIVAAIQADFVCRSRHETVITEIMMAVGAIKHAKKHLRRWMKPVKVPVALEFKPATARIVRQPLGVVGIIAPWNYPVQLALLPLVSVLAAGNRAMIKPSELTPKTSQLMAELLAEIYDEDLVAVVQGGPEVGKAFSELPFDHLIYTGSTAVGRLVMMAAAKNLVPVTLELGGKSPTIIHSSFPLHEAVKRITFGKGFNGGQTCIAPDYVFIDAARRDALVEGIKATYADFYPGLLENRDFTSVVNERHHQRLQGLLEDAREKGATILELNPEGADFSSAEHRMALHLVLDATDQMEVMQEEIFGPILPILTYESMDEVVDYVNHHPRPLALYYFDRDSGRVREMMQRTIAGMVTVNDTLTHAVIEELPFGGVGASGMGAYHGLHGFETFSHQKAVLYQSRFHALNLMNPPYGKLIERFLAFMMR